MVSSIFHLQPNCEPSFSYPDIEDIAEKNPPTCQNQHLKRAEKTGTPFVPLRRNEILKGKKKKKEIQRTR